jgi:hypothetical protein
MVFERKLEIIDTEEVIVDRIQSILYCHSKSLEVLE